MEDFHVAWRGVRPHVSTSKLYQRDMVVFSIPILHVYICPVEAAKLNYLDRYKTIILLRLKYGNMQHFLLANLN